MRQERQSNSLPGTEKGGTTFSLQRAPSLPKIGRTYEGIQTKEKTQDEPKTGKGLRLALAGLAIGGAIEASGIAAHQQLDDKPMNTQTIAEGAYQWPWTLANELLREEVPSTFDNNKERQLIGDNNIIRITPEEAEKSGASIPKIDIENKTVTLQFPFAIPQGSTAVTDKTPYNVRGIEHDNERLIIPANTPIIVSEGIYISLIKGDAESGNDPNLAYSMSFVWYDQEHNRTIGWGFWPDTNIGFKSDLQLSEQPIKGSTDLSWEGVSKLPISDGRTPVASPTQDVTLNSSEGVIFKGKGLSDPNPQKFKIKWQEKDGKLLLLAPSNK